MEIADKGSLNVHILHNFKKVKETMYIQRREWKNKNKKQMVFFNNKKGNTLDYTDRHCKKKDK